MASILPYAQARCGCRLLPCTQGQSSTSTTSSIFAHSGPIDQRINVQYPPAPGRGGIAATLAYGQGGGHLVPNHVGGRTAYREQRVAAPRGLDGFIRQGMTAEEVGKAGASGSSGVQGKRASSGDFGRGGGSYAGEMPATGGQCHASRDPRGRSTVAGQEHERATHDGNIEEDHWQKKGRERHEREYSDDEESANCAKRPRIYRCVEDNSPQPDAVPMGEGEKNIQLHDFDDNDINQGYQPAAFTNPAGRHSNYQKPSVADETSEGFSRPSLRGGGRISPPDHTHYSDPPMYRHGRGCPIHRYGRYTSPTYYNDRDDPLMPRHNHTDLVRRTISEDFFGRPAERVSHWHSFNNRDAAELLRRLAYNIVLVLVLTALARGLTMEMLVVAMVTMVTQVYPR